MAFPPASKAQEIRTGNYYSIWGGLSCTAPGSWMRVLVWLNTNQPENITRDVSSHVQDIDLRSVN